MPIKQTYNPLSGQFDEISEIALAAVGSTPNANGASISASQVLTLQPASASFPGIVITGAQTLAGDKTLSGNFLPGTDNTYALGGIGSQWSSVYTGVVNDDSGAIAVDVANRLLRDAAGNFILSFDGSDGPYPIADGIVLRGSGTLTLLPSPATVSYAITLPNAQGGSGQTLTNNGSGLLSWTTLGTGTVTSVSVVSANGLAGSVATATTTPAITLSTTITGLLQGNGTAISAATTTGSGSVVLATSPTLVTPALGTPSAVVLTNGTGLPLTTGVTGTLPIANGGTGQTTAANAFAALSPMTTLGDMIYEDATPTPVRLAGSTTATAKFLSQTGNGTISAAPAWTAYVAPTIQSFITGTSATYTTPTSPRKPIYIKIECVGSGGGGGRGTGGGTTGGGAGGGGGTAITYVVAPGTSYTYSVGVAGTAGTASGGGNGNSTTFGGVCTATGGGGGSEGTSTAGVAPGGTAGTGTVGDILLVGTGGGAGNTGVAGIISGSGGCGGPSSLGGGGPSTTGVGTAGTDGGGGGGGTSTNGGGAGGSGRIIVTEYYQ